MFVPWSDVYTPQLKNWYTLLSLLLIKYLHLSPHIPYFARSNVTHAIIQVVQIFSKYYRCYLDVRHFSSNKKNKNNWSNDFHLLASKGSFIIILLNTEPCHQNNLIKAGFKRKLKSFTMFILYRIFFWVIVDNSVVMRTFSWKTESLMN